MPGPATRTQIAVGRLRNVAIFQEKDTFCIILGGSALRQSLIGGSLTASFFLTNTKSI